MRTLKKVLALSLVFALAFTMMAGATVFTDDAQIDAQEQVDLVYALGVVAGYPDGSFGPEKTITRAEAAKMLYVLKTGKDEGSSNYASAVKPFTDTIGHWAEGYINYCYLNGIIAGVGNNKFDPEGQITGAQLAKMCLVVLGYDQTKAGLVGVNWLTNTMSLAFENKMFDDYSADVAVAAPREDAAVLFYNTIFTPTVVYRDDVYTNKNVLGNDNPTVGSTNFNLTEYTGVLVAAQGFVVPNEDSAGDPIVTGAADDEIKLIDVEINGTAVDATATLDYEAGKDMLGQRVKVVYDSNKETVYNIIPTGKNTVYDVTLGDIDEADNTSTYDIRFNNKDYTIADDVAIVNYDSANVMTAQDLIDKNSGDTVKLVDNDNDRTIDYAFVTEKTFGYVDSVDTKQITMGGESFKFLNDDDEEQIVGADNIEEGDYVLYYYDALDEIYYVEEATSVTATVEGARDNGLTIRVDGSFIEQSDIKVGSDIGDAEQTDPTIGDSYTIFMDGGYWIAAMSAEDSIEGSGNYVYIVDSQKKTSGINGDAAKVEVMIPGEDDSVIYELDRITDENGDRVGLDKFSDGEYNGEIAAYTITSNGKLRISFDIDLKDAGSIAYDEDSDVFTVGSTDMLLDDSAVIFYVNTEGKIEILGKGDFDATFSGASGKVASRTSGRFNYIKTAYIDGARVDQTGAASDVVYGYVLGDAYDTYDRDSDTNYVEMEVYTQDGQTVTIREEDGATYPAEGDVIAYKLTASGEIKEDSIEINDAITEKDGAQFGDIIAYSRANSKITIRVNDTDEKIYNLTDDTVTMYVDNDAVEGTTGSSYPTISVSDRDEYDNCLFVTDGSDIVFILVDTSSTLNS